MGMEEHSLPTQVPEVRWRFEVDGMIEGHLRKLWSRISSHIKDQMASRRHPNGSYQPDYEARLREAEGDIYRESGFRMRDYQEGPKQSWRDWILTIVGLLIVAAICGVISILVDIKADQKATLARLEEHDKRLDRLESRVFRAP